MAKKKETPVAPENTPESDAQALDVVRTLQEGYSDERDLVNQMLGQTQMADAFAKFSLTVSISKLQFVKENKLFRALKGKKTADGQQLSGTWAEFCSLLGRSRAQVDEDIANLKAMGESALESMSRMGIGYRELRQFRKLPEDQQTALIEAAKTGDKDSFLDLAEELVAKHGKEKEALAGQIETQGKVIQELNATIVADERVIEGKEKTISGLEARVAKLQNRAPDAVEAERLEQEAERRIKIQHAADALWPAVSRFAQTIADCLKDTDPHTPLYEYAVAAVQYAFQQINTVAQHNEIPVDFSDIVTPEWMRSDLPEAGEA